MFVYFQSQCIQYLACADCLYMCSRCKGSTKASVPSPAVQKCFTESEKFRTEPNIFLSYFIVAHTLFLLSWCSHGPLISHLKNTLLWQDQPTINLRLNFELLSASFVTFTHAFIHQWSIHTLIVENMEVSILPNWSRPKIEPPTFRLVGETLLFLLFSQ